MIARAICLCFVMLVVASCGPRYVEFYPYTDEGSMKPRVSLSPVVDSSKGKLPWDVSEEITQGIRYQLCCEGKLYLPDQEEVDSCLASMGNVDRFGIDLMPWKGFCNTDYVVFIDIFERKEEPYEKGKYYPIFPVNAPHTGNVLAMKIRVKVVDIRGLRPKIALDEILESNHFLPWGYEKIDYTDASWDSDAYSNTPVCTIHRRLICQLTQRLKSVISDVR